MNMQLQTQIKAESMPIPAQATILQRKCEDCQKKRLTMQRSAANNSESLTVPPIVHEVLNSPGQPLDTGTRAFMEPRFGHDFSKVRVHDDAKAADSARAVNALAYTIGSDIVFGPGRYSTHLPEGKRLLAHELTHVVQQTGEKNRMNRLTEEPANDLYEQEADCVMERVMQGNSVTVSQHKGGVALHRTIGDGHDLTATRFSGNLILEAVFDNERLLQLGDSGTAVRLIQESLIAQGYNLPHGADSNFGAETKMAVRQFQIDTGARSTDGIIGQETMRLLDMHDTGTTKATGPRATAPAVGAPAAPVATGVVFSEEPGEQFAGYDSSTAPNWLVVPAAGRRRVAAAIAPAGARPAITSLNPAVSTVAATPTGVVVTGVAKGTTEIQAEEGGVILDRLQISVKDRLDRSVAFHYVCDSAVPHPHCSNGRPPAETMRSLLNRVWERQANVRFTNGGVANVVAPGDLGPAVDWTSPGGGEWNTVTALGLGANYNVFRVWNYLQDGVPTNGAANLGHNAMISDNTCADGLGLPHECGHYLGVDHADGFIMTPCGGRADLRVSKAMVDKVNP